MELEERTAGDVTIVKVTGDITLNKGGALKLVNVTKRLRDLLVVTKLLTVFDRFDDEASAVATFTA